MEMQCGSKGLVLAAALLATVSLPTTGFAQEWRTRHVLLISIDGFHAVDLEVCVAKGTCPHLAGLTRNGATYTNASTTKPADSFPGLLAQLTGGTPKSTGVFYDDSYDRTLFAPGSNCTVGPGTETNIAEPVDFNLHSIDGGVNASLTGLNSAVAINPSNLPGSNAHGSCTPVWPHNLVRVNTVFGVLHEHHLRTAWSDKHPAYDLINGKGPAINGPGTNVDDFFAPEINSDLSQANINLIAQLGLHSTAAAPVANPSLDFTGSIDGVEWYDGLKVQAVLNEISGLDHTGTHHLGVPALFGMNFQSVSVGQKLQAGGYTDPFATPSAKLANAISFVDASIGQMVAALKQHGLGGDTLIIVSAKHGQSPIDVTKRKALDDSAVIAAPIGGNFAFDIADDGALIWLKPPYSAAKVAAAVAALNAFQAAGNDTGIVEWLAGPLLSLPFQDPANDSRTPDIIGIARTGVIYTGGSKIAEHGGFNEDDTHVALVVAGASVEPSVVTAAVSTTQIAPTILGALGIDPLELEAVRMEGTSPLPGLR
jgi:Type I phosphodiesterase / nucleotide pyrophosphatase